MQNLPAWFYAILLFVSSRGRIGRARYWLGLAGLIAWALFVAYLARGGLDRLPLALSTAGLIGLPTYCVLAKRLHDIGRTARIATLPGVLLAAVLVYRGGPAVQWNILSWLLVASAGLCLLVLAGLGITPGQAGENRYGHAPGTEVLRTAGLFD